MAVAERQRGKEAAYSIGENFKTANLNVFEENLPSFPTLSTNLRGAMKKTQKVPTAPSVPRRSPIQVLTGPNIA